MEISKPRTKSEYDELVNGGLVLVKYSADWCNPCKVLTKTIEKMPDLCGFNVVEIDCEEDAFIDLCEESRIRNLPTLIFYKDGKELGRNSGTMTAEQLLDRTKSLL